MLVSIRRCFGEWVRSIKGAMITDKAETETTAGFPPAGSAHSRLRWHQSLFGKITLFLIAGVISAYGVGALAGLLMVERNSQEQWRRQAEMNAQIASFTVRNIYTFVAVEADPSGQIIRILSERPLGDDESVLDTGFNPVDVLALAAAQTKNEVWLFRYDKETGSLISSADATGATSGEHLAFPTPHLPNNFFTGFATIGEREHFIASLPVATSAGELLGSVVTSIGEAEELLRTRDDLVRNSFLALIAMLVVISLVVTLVMRRLFRPVPALVKALTRIARDDTGTVTPFQGRHDEIGRLAVAIETLREAVVERENLRQVREVAKQMEHMAHHDSLTGLPNRAFFNKALADAIETTASEGSRFNVMLLDLDRFKSVNDTFGHAAGDALLVAATERVAMLLGPKDIAARLGGDEFALLQWVDQDPMSEASRLAEAVVSAIGTPFTILGNRISIGTSVGIACAPSHGATAATLLKSADVALYCSKTRGRGNHSFFTESMVMATPNLYALEQDLDMALERGQFALHYQPIVTLAGGKIAGYEALLRWRHPEHGMIPPDRFIPLAEETGQIVKIGEWVIRQASRDARQMPEDTVVTVNISAIQLHHRSLVDTLRSALAESGLAPSRFEVEITESVMLSDAIASSVIGEIDAMGVGIVLDDFGTGYASLSYLRKLPIRKIKIDRSFIDGLAARTENGALVSGIVQLARSLGIQTTAEGVESEIELELLRLAGCDLAQGYHIGRPAPLTRASAPIKRSPIRTSSTGAS